MDPIANIKEQRDLAAAIIERTDAADRGEDATWLIDYAQRLAELVIALDEWRTNGGFDPYTTKEE